MVRFKTAFAAIAVVMIIHIFAISAGAYHAVTWFDVPMHFFGGYVMAMLGLAGYSWITERVDIRPKADPKAKFARTILEGMFVVGFAMIISVAWEWYEFLFDQFATNMVREYGFAQMGLPDTMNDFLNDFVGAMVAWGLWRQRD